MSRQSGIANIKSHRSGMAKFKSHRFYLKSWIWTLGPLLDQIKSLNSFLIAIKLARRGQHYAKKDSALLLGTISSKGRT